MNRHFIGLILALFCAGCATTSNAPQVMPQDKHLLWTQKPEERGLLPFGRVIAIESLRTRSEKYTFRDATMYMTYTMLYAIAIPIMVMSIPFVGLPEPAPKNISDGKDLKFTVRLQKTNEEVIRYESWSLPWSSFRIGDCVAIRPMLLVIALKDQCELTPYENKMKRKIALIESNRYTCNDDLPGEFKTSFFSIGKELYELRQFNDAIECFQKTIGKNDSDKSEAYYHLGMIYEIGLGVESNQTKAKEYYSKSGLLN